MPAKCHLETSNQKLPTEVVRLNRIPFSYVPGQPLGDYEVAFNREQGNLRNFEIAQERAPVPRIAMLSARARESWTASPATIPMTFHQASQHTAHYNQVCLNCHQPSRDVAPQVGLPQFQARARVKPARTALAVTCRSAALTTRFTS